ncbi:hypothetical protein JCM10908_006535 [Rhodotorula pacifica]|uniref:Fmp40p n=1 Tax=Rhodotorula pacifica TaxID=1495444 RepID=UPI003170B786
MTTDAPSPSSLKRSSLLSLPVSSHAPIYHLPPDPLFPTPASLLHLAEYDAPPELGQDGPVALKEGDPVPPSMLRRSRQIRRGGCFTFVSPLPIEFPYDIREDKDEERTNSAKPSTIETHLAEYEISLKHPVRDATGSNADSTARPTAFSSAVRESERYPRARLLSLNKTLAADWLPQLELGTDVPGDAVRQQLVDVIAGKTVVAHEPDPSALDKVGKDGFAPWSLCYAGHQFGSFAGQLGDGRAISILSTPAAEEVGTKTGYRAIELQLKGAGRTPYSRFADGLAVLRSSIREYLGAEAVAALGVPTSRALALVHLPEVKVRREMMENAAIVTRVAGSWIRIGNFEQQAYRGEYDSMRALSRYVAREVFSFSDENPAGTGPSRSLGLHVLREVARRNALMVAGWQTYGFCHGVINTDNVAINGSTIDYGPYAFMDIFDPGHICNHSDDMGRYKFSNQPTMVLFAMQKLGEAMSELIGAEVELAEKDASGSSFVEVPEGWASSGDGSEEMKRWKEMGLKEVDKVKNDFVQIFRDEYERLMRLRLGLATGEEEDFQLVSRWLDLLAQSELDFTASHRLLSQFVSTSDSSFDRFLDAFLPSTTTTDPTGSTKSTNARSDWTGWFKSYEERLAREGSIAAGDRRQRMDRVNPRFCLRQWVLEETIRKCDRSPQGPEGGIEQLERVLHMSLNPFESYGEPEIAKGETDVGACPTKEEQERQRLCGLGSEELLGFQCSCSS